MAGSLDVPALPKNIDDGIGGLDVWKIAYPRILGFAGSRENQPNSYTHGPDIDSELQIYQHREYLACKACYRQEFDYYSVDMILLEIGPWKTLSRMTKAKRFKDISDEGFRREILKSKAPQLGILMGIRYMEATRICLEGGFAGTSADADAEDNCSTAFKSLVMDMVHNDECFDFEDHIYVIENESKVPIRLSRSEDLKIHHGPNPEFYRPGGRDWITLGQFSAIRSDLMQQSKQPKK
ncbi:hypothetical protein QBC38DRAFT_462443 [Podospora fimiseda]|uniref:Uncharacterized protein n=1 Tax=Podospora fimiseda TaxID=252190 RepID=A0AAN7BEA0_9PEZI|nr:hypothetical protein QBC38DRAFT_462443 [Podospora fimiseda]